MDHDSSPLPVNVNDLWDWVRHTVRLAVEGEPVTWSDLTQVDPSELDHHELTTLMRMADRIRDAAVQVRDAIGNELAGQLGDGAVLRYGAGFVQVARPTKTVLHNEDGFRAWLGDQIGTQAVGLVWRLFNPKQVKKTGFPDYDRKAGSALFNSFFAREPTGSPRATLRPIQASTAKWIANLSDGALWVPPRKEQHDDERNE